MTLSRNKEPTPGYVSTQPNRWMGRAPLLLPPQACRKGASRTETVGQVARPRESRSNNFPSHHHQAQTLPAPPDLADCAMNVSKSERQPAHIQTSVAFAGSLSEARRRSVIRRGGTTHLKQLAPCCWCDLRSLTLAPAPSLLQSRDETNGRKARLPFQALSAISFGWNIPRILHD
jgi:hypothetical protein